MIKECKLKKIQYFELRLIKQTICSKNNIKYVKYGNIVTELKKLKKMVLIRYLWQVLLKDLKF